jgi:histidinol-phosphate aminotransferase
MRIGYAFGSQELIRAMNDVRYSYNSYPMTRLSVALGTAALKDESYFQDTISRVIETREWTKKELARLGFSFPDSKTNFIFAVHKSKKATDIFAYLREKHIFVRHFGDARIDNYLRISIGTREEMETLIRELEAWLNL